MASAHHDEQEKVTESECKLGGQRSPTVVSGPLAGYSAGFRQALIDQGYARRTIGDQMSMVAHLSRWLQCQCLDVRALQSAAEIDRFFAERRACGCQTRISSVALAGLLAFLREREIIGSVTKPLDSPAERLLAEYRVYLSDERGTAASTIRGFTACAAMFLDAIAVSGKSLDETLNELSAAGITRFVGGWARSRSHAYGKSMVSALRSLLRFLPSDVGAAMADYVRHGRPRSGSRLLFVRVRAPFEGLSPESVGSVVHRACGQAGLARFGPHRLRHAVACQLQRDGASLEEIGQLLRQRDPRTTARGSALFLSTVVALQFLPVLLFSRRTGVLVTRLRAGRLLIVTQSLQLAGSLGYAIPLFAGWMARWYLCLLTFALGFVTTVDVQRARCSCSTWWEARNCGRGRRCTGRSPGWPR